MEKDKYNELVKRWEDWKTWESEYLEKRINIIREYRDDEDLQYKKVRELEEQYNANDFNQIFGPWTTIYDKEDLLDRNFILPGLDSCFLDLNDIDQNEIINSFGKNIWDYFGEHKGVVIGFGYDSGDYYLLSRDLSGKNYSINLLEKYRVE